MNANTTETTIGAGHPAPARRWRRAALAAVCAAGLGAAACSGFPGSGDGTSTVTETVGENGTAQPPQPTNGGGGNNGGGNDGGGGGGNGGGGSVDCGVNPDAAIITDSIDTVAPPPAGEYWSYTGESNFNPCATLTYARFEQMPQGNAQFATKILMFNEGRYLGVDTENAQQGEIIDSGNDWFTVRYKDWEALDEAGGSNAEAPNYTEDVTFRWNAEAGKVDVEGRLPN